MMKLGDITELRSKLSEYEKKYPIQKRDNEYQEGLTPYLCNLDCTEDGNAIRLVARFGHKFRYVHEQKGWIVWEGKRWAETKHGEMMAMAKQTVRYLGYEAVAAREMDRDHADSLWKWSKASQSKKRFDAMIDLAKAEPGITIEQNELDADDYLLNVQNGTINLKNYTIQPHNPRDLITKIAGCGYDPAAQCPEWSNFIQKISCGSQGLADFHQDLCGSSVVGKQLDAILAVHFGLGNNGKSVYVLTLKAVLGGYAATATSDLFLSKKEEGISNERAGLTGVRFLAASETEEGKRLNESLVKSMTGSDTQKVRFLHKEFFEMTPKFTCMLMTNPKPKVFGMDKGIWRRLKFVPWKYDFTTDPDKRTVDDVLALMKAEQSGILNWLLYGYKRRMETVEIVVPEEVRRETEEYHDECDKLLQFVQDHCITNDPKATIQKSDLYEKYKQYAEELGQEHAMTMPNFGIELKKRSYIPHLKECREAGTGKRCWRGIRLRTEFDSPLHEKQDTIPTTDDDLATVTTYEEAF